MTDKPFRVLLDLMELHIENFKYVWINVSPRELKTISDFKKYVLLKLNLVREDIQLFVQDGLLLEEETIIILRENDTVKVQYEGQLPNFQNSSENSGEKYKKLSRKRNRNESNIIDASSTHKKSKTDTEILICSPYEIDFKETKKKKKKHQISDLSAVGSEKNHSIEFEESCSRTENQKKKKNKKTLIASNHSAADANFSKGNDSFVSFEIGEPSPKQDKNQSPKSVILKPDDLINSSSYSSPKENQFSYHSSNEGLLIESSEINIEVNKNSEGVINNCPKKKRKRRRKRKQKSLSSEISITVNSDDVSNESISLSKSNGNISGKHVMYSSPDKSKDAHFYDASQSEKFSDNTFIRKEEKPVKPSCSYPKISTPAQLDGCSNPDFHVSLSQTKNSTDCNLPSSNISGSVVFDKSVVKHKTFPSYIKENKSTPEKKFVNLSPLHKVGVHITYENGHSNSENKPTEYKNPIVKENTFCQSSEESKNTSRQSYADLPDLNCFPKIGTRIAYKTLELDESYSPVITDYREGIIKSIKPDTEEVEIEFYKELIKPGRTGKFENLLDDEIPPPEIKTCDILKWSSVISPKLIS